MEDERFSRFTTDPKFRSVSKREKKLKIDPRFKHVFTDKRFDNKKVGVDKRGRPKSFASKESYEKFYRLGSSDEDSDGGEGKEGQPISAKNLKKIVDKKGQQSKNNCNDTTDATSTLNTNDKQEYQSTNSKQIERKKINSNIDYGFQANHYTRGAIDITIFQALFDYLALMPC